MADRFLTKITAEGGRVSLQRSRLIGKAAVPVAEWASAGPTLKPVVARIERLLHEGRLSVTDNGQSVTVPPFEASSLTAGFADILGFPPIASASCRLEAHGRIDQPDTTILTKWRDSDYNQVRPERTGAFLRYAGKDWRLTAPVFALLEAIDAFNSSLGADSMARVGAWGPVQEALRAVTGEMVDADQYLSSMTIYQAGSFALDVAQTQDGPNFVPVLMGREKRQQDLDETYAPEDDALESDTDDLRDEQTDALLPPEMQDDFSRHRFVSDKTIPEAYVLGRNQFVILEPSLQTALKVVQEKRRASEAERREFIKNPRIYLESVLDDHPSAAGLFVETSQYSERVLGLKLWDPVELSWLAKFKTAWLPEGIPLIIDGQEVLLNEPPEALAERVLAAKAAGKPMLELNGREIQISTLENAMEAFMPPEPKEPDAADKELPGNAPVRDVLDIEDNIEDATFVVDMAPKTAETTYEQVLKDRVKSSPKPHQNDGINWLIDAWKAGWPGVLLADDMGLGKTFQSLVFLAWRSAELEVVGSANKPILVVAPTALLRTWIQESELHLEPDVLGECIEAFGSELRELKAPKGRGWTPETALDVPRLRKAGWILTTYETLATYHRAFARVGYTVVVFDEMQRIKSPTTLNTHAAKSMSAEFVLGLTGTPVENRLEDLWCIMDRIAPGLLGDLKQFSATYAEASAEQLRELKSKLEQSKKAPPVLKRRMKEDNLEGLPAKTIETYQAPMPDRQANAYAQTVSAVQSLSGNRATILEAIHRFRGISMHPELNAEIPFGDIDAFEAWAMQSSRVMLTLDVLDGIRDRGEKALLFLEYKAAQQTMAAGLAARYSLGSEPMIINGDVAGSKRQPMVGEFQAESPGFDVMILSPRAAGVGLTITAANHVIHLSRWWNPAVEDQCNDRVYRIGQEKPVTVHVPLAVHPSYGQTSFDLKLDALLQRKRALSDGLLAPPESKGDVNELFSGVVPDGPVPF